MLISSAENREATDICARMTRLLWTMIALFPLPLVVLLLAEPPELFERTRVQATYSIAAMLEASDVDLEMRIASHGRMAVSDVLPQDDGPIRDPELMVERRGDQLFLTAPASGFPELRYRLTEACWDMPADQITLLRRCPA